MATLSYATRLFYPFTNYFMTQPHPASATVSARTKCVIRYLPPTLPENVLKKAIGDKWMANVGYWHFMQGKKKIKGVRSGEYGTMMSSLVNDESRCSACWLSFKQERQEQTAGTTTESRAMNDKCDGSSVGGNMTSGV